MVYMNYHKQFRPNIGELLFCCKNIYGHKVEYFSAGSVGPVYLYDIHELPPFHRIMVAGGSASITNAILGVVLFILLIRIRKMPPMLRLFLTQLMEGSFLKDSGIF